MTVILLILSLSFVIGKCVHFGNFELVFIYLHFGGCDSFFPYTILREMQLQISYLIRPLHDKVKLDKCGFAVNHCIIYTR